MKNPFQTVRGLSYPTVPAMWPNRAVRRALKYGRSLPGTWTQFFAMHPEFRKLVLTNKFAA